MTRVAVAVRAGTAEATGTFVIADGTGQRVGVWPAGTSAGEFREITGRPVTLRRADFPDRIPLSITDAGIRPGENTRMFITLYPGRGSSPEQAAMLAGSLRDAGIDAAFAFWPEMHRTLRPAQFQVISELYAPAVRAAGFPVLFCVSNYAAITANALEQFWPGRDFADGVSVSFYPSGLSLKAAARFADGKGIPFGLCEFGVPDDSYQSLTFLRYIREFFADRAAAGNQNGDLVMLSGVRDGDYTVRSEGVVQAYRDLFDTLTS